MTAKAIEPDDFEEIQKALNEASGKASALWVAFITFELYLAIAFGSVTHRALFLEETIKLPVLNVDLPLAGFFIVAPAVLVIFHFYVFLQLLALAERAKSYNELLKKQPASDNDAVRQRLDGFLILQFLVGPSKQRKGYVGLCLRLVAWITLVGAPILILLQGQITFLPYHQQLILWVLRLWILVDLLVIWFFWNPVRSDDDSIVKQIPAAAWWTVGGIATGFVVVFSICNATFPGEYVDRFFTSPPLRTLLFEGPVEEVSGRPRSLFSNRLILTDQIFVDPDKLDKTEVSHSFRGRDLRGVVLTRADLRKADFTGAMLNGANFDSAKLRNARFGCEATGARRASLLWPDDGCAWLQDASFAEASLQGVNFERARLEGADFRKALVQGASFIEAHLHGASFIGANLIATNFEMAVLQGANFDGARLQGDNFHQTKAQGAKFDRAHLQGATISDAKLTLATLAGVKVWRVRGTAASNDFADTDLPGLDLTATPWAESDPATRSFTAWFDQNLKEILSEKARDQITLGLGDITSPNVINEDFWQREMSKPPLIDQKVATLTVGLICQNEDASHVLRGLLRSGRLSMTDSRKNIVAQTLRQARSDTADCAALRHITNDVWSELKSNGIDTEGAVSPRP